MHDTTANDDYSWPTCTAPNCRRQLWVSETGRQACRPCEDQTVKRLTELPALFIRLNETAALMRGARQPGGAPSGSRTPPIPLRLEVLALTANGGVVTRLQAIEDSWRQALGWETPPTVDERTIFPVSRDAAGRVRVGRPVKGDRVYPHWRTPTAAKVVSERIRFLANNLPWACDAYDSVGQDIDELRRLHAECTAAVANERRPGRVQTGPCPTVLVDGERCRAQLTAVATSHRIRCGTCGTEWADLGAWRTLRQQQDAVLAEA